MEYERKERNNWHYVTIVEADEPGCFMWTNRAGWQWTLKQDESDSTQFDVGEECPYYDWGGVDEANFMTTEVYLGDDGKVSGIRGPWGELYTKIDK